MMLALKQYARENLHQLLVELIMQYLNETVLPNMAEQTTGSKLGDENKGNMN